MLNNNDITLYNAYYDKVTDITKYKRTYLYGVDWQGKQAVTVSEKGLLSADSIQIFITYNVECGKQYIGPKAFERLTENEKDNYFTFKSGDKIVKGIIDFELTGIKPNNTAYLENYYDDVINIISVVDCELTRNWEIGGK